MLIVGIDPGYSGAIAFLDPQGPLFVVHDMPVAPSVKGRTELDLNQLYQLLRQDYMRKVVMLEKVATMPGQGISSAFRFGQGYGAIEMALVACGYERHYVTPPVWKKYFGLSKDKGSSRALACQRLPDHAFRFSRVKDDGRAEATLLALYAQEKLNL